MLQVSIHNFFFYMIKIFDPTVFLNHFIFPILIKACVGKIVLTFGALSPFEFNRLKQNIKRLFFITFDSFKLSHISCSVMGFCMV